MSVRFPPEVEARDEAFWQAQERRKKGLLGQPCCTQSKMSWALMDVPGDFAVVIHGEFDCLNCFHHHLGVSAHQFYSTRLSDLQITTGDTQRPLEHLLRLIVAERTPAAIIVLGTCPVEVIGDRFEVVAERVSKDTGTPILAMHTSGLKLTSLTDCQDWLFERLASLPQGEPIDQGWVTAASEVAMDVVLSDAPVSTARAEALHARLAALPAPRPDGRRVNLLGLPDAHPEPLAVLGGLGVVANGFFPHGASLDHWRSIGHAEAAYTVDASVFPQLSERLREGYGQRVVDVQLPIGVAATERFYATIADDLGLTDALEAAIAPVRAGGAAAVEAARSEIQGARLGMTIRMLNTYQVDRVVQMGLGDLEHLREVGFDVTLLVQGPLEEGPKFEASLRAAGVDVPCITFPGPFVLGDLLRDEGFDVAIVPDSSRNTARRVGIPMLAARSLQPWFAGVEANVGVLVDLVRQGRAIRGRS